MDCTPPKNGSHSSPSPTTCQYGLTEKGTLVTRSPEYYRGCNRPANKGLQASKHITPTAEAVANCHDSVTKRNVARVLFYEQMVEPTQGNKISTANLIQRSYVREEATSFSQQPMTNPVSVSLLSTVDGSVSMKRRQLISDYEVQQVVSQIKPPLNTDNNVFNLVNTDFHLSPPAISQDFPTSWASNKGWEAEDDSEDETVYLPDKSVDDEELERSWMGYEEELFQIERDRKKMTTHIDGFSFEKSTNNRKVMEMGQRFKDDFQFRRAIEVQAIRDGIKLCVMDDTSTCVSCECSDLDCDWKITAIKECRGNVFVISYINPKHTCKKC